jgi:hypothetical protein
VARHVPQEAESGSASTSTTLPPPVTSRAGLHIVSFQGVHVAVPLTWPVVDGMHTRWCGGPFPSTPTAFVGPQLQAPPSCPAPVTHQHEDGVWLQPERSSPDDGAVTEPDGRIVEQQSGDGEDVEEVWFHDVQIDIGIGADPTLAQGVYDSIGFTPEMPDTPAEEACALSNDASHMPTPRRLTAPLVLDDGNDTLDPPAATDQPQVSASTAWGMPGEVLHQPFETYRIVLARFSAKYPATLGSDGSYQPEIHNVLAWVVLSAPISSSIPGCGAWGIAPVDATTGQGLGSSSYAPGP